MGTWLSKTTDNDVVAAHSRDPTRSAVLHRDVNAVPPMVTSDANNTLRLSDGWGVYDGSGGAAVSILGHGYKDRIWAAMGRAFFEVDYTASLLYTTAIEKALANALIATTHGHMAKTLIYNSGSDAVEAAIKLARQFHVENGEDERTYYIARMQSYHGATLGALALSGHVVRRGPYECILTDKVKHVSACNPYRDRIEGESDGQYVQRKVQELQNMFKRLGPRKVIAFFFEPVVGAALGCATPVPGYLGAMKKVCHEHGALFIADEIMCGMGRTGTLHAWEQEEDAVPDIQVMGKGLAAGAQPVAAMLLSQRIADVLGKGTGTFHHGHTFQNHPTTCAAALEVLKIVQENDYALLANVRQQGGLLKRLLQDRLGSHPNIGDIRGRGLFLNLEFVNDKATKTPFDPKLHVYAGIGELGKGRDYQISLYPGSGTKDGINGDHVIIAPPFNITEAEVYMLVGRTEKLVTDYFNDLNGKLEKNDGSKP